MSFNDELSGHCVIDLETVASPNVADLLDPVRPPSNYRDEAKIKAYCAEKLAERIATAGREADLCEIVAIGFTMPDLDQTVESFTRAEMDESLMVRTLWQMIGNRCIIGFNCLNFDLPVLIRRSQLLGIRCPAVNLDRYRTLHIDLLERLTFNGRLTMRSLAFYCRRFDITQSTADSVSGADIAGLVDDGEWEAIKDHVRYDVIKTAALAQRLGYLRGVRHEESVL